GEPVAEALKDALPDARILFSLDGLTAYESAAKASAIAKLPFVTNSFLILKNFEGRTMTEMAADAARDGAWAIAPLRGTFRVIASVASQLVSLDGKVMEAIEKRIAEKTKLRTNRAKPDHEFWLLERSEGHGFFALRLSHHQAYDKSLQKGELRPELANILCRLSDPAPNELFLDPFCGSGAIPIQRAGFSGAGLVIASDNDPAKVEALKQRIKDLGLRKRVVVRRDDALNLDRYEDGSIHKIVTDPPWGHFVDLPSADFYPAMLSEFARVLRSGGKLVILTAEDLKPDERFALRKKFNILVSGKKAAVYVMERQPR
ncbi:MAG TPA: methyltransferase domain-containing protein, partial [Bryobacteraceae bacterium]|nr:methyltransferase domain-containing protein [Bryobacteraceae bacterium]